MKGVQIDGPPQKKLLTKSPALFGLHISQNSQESTSATKRLLKACSFFKIETVTQVFSSEFWKTFKTFFTEHLRVTASATRITPSDAALVPVLLN